MSISRRVHDAVPDWRSVTSETSRNGSFTGVRRETGKEYVVRFHDDEGVANHIDLEPCAAAREGGREASVEGRIGQPLSRERTNIRGADDIPVSEGNTVGRAIARARPAPRGRRTWHVQKLLAREPGGLTTDHRTALVRIGKAMSCSR